MRARGVAVIAAAFLVLLIALWNLTLTVRATGPRKAGDFASASPRAEAQQRAAAAAGPPPPPPSSAQPERVAAVRAAIAHAFAGYTQFAWGKDELNPLSRTGVDSFDAAGATIVDSLSTLWLANLTDQFEAAKAWVLDHDYSNLRGNLFETNIRVVGGLLSAGALSGTPMFFFKAQAIADRMLGSFGTPSGIPCNSFPDRRECGSANLAESGTLVLEFGYLSHVSGKRVYAEAAEKAMDSIVRGRAANTGCQLKGLYPSTVSTADGSGACGGTMGGGADSFYESLLKYSLVSGEPRWKALWDESAQGVADHLVACTVDGLSVLTSNHNGHKGGGLEHLACFAPGMLALGDFPRHGALAQALTESCLVLYTASPSGLGADGANLAFGPEAKCAQDASPQQGRHRRTPTAALGNANLQRPEVLESVFYMWRATRDEYYRDVAWRLFQSMEAHAKVATGGYASARNVNTVPPELEDRQQSFFLAETLKYLLLTFSDDALLDLDRWVFNTEAHPLPVYAPKRP